MSLIIQLGFFTLFTYIAVELCVDPKYGYKGNAKTASIFHGATISADFCACSFAALLVQVCL